MPDLEFEQAGPKTLPSGKQPRNYENHHFEWVNQLFKWAMFNSYVNVYRRVGHALELFPRSPKISEIQSIRPRRDHNSAIVQEKFGRNHET